MDLIKQFIRAHQQALVLVVGYALVAALAFGLGRFTKPKQQETPKVQTQEAATSPTNYNSNLPATQSAGIPISTNCEGKVKGNASSKIYHLLGDSFYNRLTNPTCFNTEADAKAAGFRKSAR